MFHACVIGYRITTIFGIKAKHVKMLRLTHVLGPIVCGYFENFYDKILVLNRGLRLLCFKLEGKC